MREPLPPPPEHPELSPPVFIAGEEAVTLPGLAGEPSLEARVRVPPGASRGVVLCHPHPLYGGSMHSAVVVAVARVLADWGKEVCATLRFNTRGVGTSGGSYGGGAGETLDARAAIRALKERAPSVPLTVCGYSFGTWVGLRAAALEGGIDRVALIAPAVRIFDFLKEDGLAFRGRLEIFVGDHDGFCDLGEARKLAADLGAGLQVFEGSDHYFLRSRRKLAASVAPFLVPGLSAPP